MTEVRRFILQGRTTFGVRHPAGTFVLKDEQTGEDLGSYSSLAGTIEDIAKRVPLATMIAYRWDHSDFDTFKPATVEDWLRSTAPQRGVKKDAVEEHMNMWRERETQLAVRGEWE